MNTMGAVYGNVTATAGKDYRQVGSDVIAPKGDVTITAQSVTIQEARETSASQTETKFRQSGISVGISNPLISAAQTAQSLGQAAGNTSDSRMQALAAAAAALNGYNTYNSLTDKAGNFSPAKAADISLNISIGSSRSQSNSNSQSDSARGSTVTAGNNITIQATGAGKDSNLRVEGSQVQAGNNVALSADGQINLLAAQNTASQTSSNSSSSSSVGVSYSPASGWGVNASASRGQGSGNGSDVSYTNTQIQAGNTASLNSGGDTTLKGAVVAANTVQANVGGNLNIESLQDTSTYTSRQSSAGGSISFGGGKLTGGGISAGRSNIDSNFASVNQQSGIQAGDGGFQVGVTGNADLQGGVIASTQTAIDQNRNRFTTGGTLTTSDIQNSASYEGQAIGISASIGKSIDSKGNTNYLPGVGFGLGGDKGSASSTTTAGISGIAGNTAVRTGDAQTGIGKIFDAAKVQSEIDAQVQITQAFGKDASKAVGDYAQAQEIRANSLRTQAQAIAESDPQGAATLDAQAQQIEKNWGANGTLRLAAHTLIGGLTGGASGALGAAAGTLTAPAVAKALSDANITGPLASTLTALASTAVGAATGGTAGAGAALNEVVNNFLSHPENQARLNAARACAAGDAKACTTRDAWDAIDKERDAKLRAACYSNGASAECSVRYADMLLARNSYNGQTTSAAINNRDIAAGLYQYTPAVEQDGFKSLLNVPHYDAEAIAKAITVAKYAAVTAGAIVLAPELATLAAAAKLTLATCQANLVLCANQASIFLTDLAAGEALGGATVAVGVTGTAKGLSTLESEIAALRNTEATAAAAAVGRGEVSVGVKGGVSVASGFGDAAPMTVVRTIKPGETVANIVNEAKGLTFGTGNEYAVVTLANGDRALVSGGPGGINFPEGSIKNIFGHTHPTNAPPSAADAQALIDLEQSKQYVFHGGEVTVVRPK